MSCSQGSSPGDIVALTGSSDGIGAHLARVLTARGSRVHGAGRRAQEPALGFLPARVDVRSEDEVGAWAQAIRAGSRRIDVLIHCAGVFGAAGRVEDIGAQAWRDALDTNVLGLALVCRSIIPLLREGVSPLILVLGSLAGRWGRAGFATYAATKAAQEALAQVLSQELALDGIRVVTLYPSRVSTSLRQVAYPTEGPLPGAALDAVERAVCALISRRATLASGVTLYADDVDRWLRPPDGAAPG